MRLRFALLLVLVAALAVAGGGAARPTPQASLQGEETSHLENALDDIAWALDHEEDADDAFHEAGAFADYYGAGQLFDSRDHLEDALHDLADAVKAGEIDPISASHIADHINEALDQDGDAFDTIAGGGTVGHTISHLHDALDEKENAGDLIYYGDVVESGDEGCSLNYSSIGGGDWFAGFDDCLRPIKRLIVDPGFMPTRVSEGFVGNAGRIESSFPCVQALGLISCTPSKPIVKPEYIFVDFGPRPAFATTSRAIAVGTDGKAQIAPFSVTGGTPVTDLGMTGTVFQVTPLGLVAPRNVGGTPSLGAGLVYGFDFQLANYSPVPAPNAKVDISLPAGFKLLGSYPTGCKQTGSALDCPLGTLRATDADSVLVWGTFRSTGAIRYGATLSSDATEPAGDTNPNSYSVPVGVYGVPSARLEQLSRSILSGGSGTIFGSAAPGATFKPSLERVTKVELAFRLLPQHGFAKAPAKCRWVTPSGKLSSSKKLFKVCPKAVWMAAKGTSKWTFRLRKGLARGRYEVLARATNAAGLTTSVFDPKKRSEAVLTVRR